MQKVDDKEIAILIVSVCGCRQPSESLTADSSLLGAIPELDSMSIVNLIVALEKRYDFKWHDDEMEESIFLTLGSLTHFVQLKVDTSEPMQAPANKNHSAM